ncbi:hypothetical protein CVT25_009643 [Psilocybe cyanescens]|uniref:Uncharacterized protein n=1 Tax=Psilocybe cyanescens TaxID=93625 RepID=A0A409XGX2_PSICY|nr:hypothetical protein CVT25_009643 [Psilocybe cyanescens]
MIHKRTTGEREKPAVAPVGHFGHQSKRDSSHCIFQNGAGNSRKSDVDRVRVRILRIWKSLDVRDDPVVTVISVLLLALSLNRDAWWTVGSWLKLSSAL